MKVKVDIEVTPEEIRALIGLPDVQGIQDDLVQYIRDGMRKGVDTLEAVTMLRQFLPESLRTASALQNVFTRGWSKIMGDSNDTDAEEMAEALDEAIAKAQAEADEAKAGASDTKQAEKESKTKTKAQSDSAPE